MNLFPAHCKEKIIIIAPSPRTCSFFIPTEENMPGIQLPMAGEATDLHCLFPKWMQFLDQGISQLSAKELPLQQLETDRQLIKVRRMSGCRLPTSNSYICNTNPIPRPRGSLGRGAGIF